MGKFCRYSHLSAGKCRIRPRGSVEHECSYLELQLDALARGDLVLICQSEAVDVLRVAMTDEMCGMGGDGRCGSAASKAKNKNRFKHVYSHPPMV